MIIKQEQVSGKLDKQSFGRSGKLQSWKMAQSKSYIFSILWIAIIVGTSNTGMSIKFYWTFFIDAQIETNQSLQRGFWIFWGI